MRVVHVAGAIDHDIGGSAVAAINTAGYTRAAGADAVLASTMGPRADVSYVGALWPALPVHAFPRRWPSHYWNSPGLRRWLAHAVPDADLVVIHGVFKVPFLDAAWAARRARVPYVIEPHGSLDPYDLQKHRLAKRLYGPAVVRPLLSAAEGVVVTSEREGRLLMTFGAAPAVHTLPLAVPGPADGPSGMRFRHRVGLPDEAEVVLFLSRVDPKKGLERLLAACARLRRAHSDLRLVVAGSADSRSYEEHLRRLAQRLGVDDIVTWTGFLLGGEKWDALAGGDVFVLPSDNENFGMVVVEALLAGTPVLISDEVYLGDDLGGLSAVSICQRDPDSVAQVLAGMLDDRIALRTETAAARASIVERFSPEAVTARTMELYEGLSRSRSAG